MKKRLFFSIDFPPEVGGIQNYAYGIVSNLDAKATSVLTATGKNKEEARSFDNNQHFSVFRTNMEENNGKISKVRLFSKLFLILVKLKFKLNYKEIHFVNVFPIGILGPVMQVCFRIRYAVYIHGLDVLSLKNSFLSKKLLLFILHRANRVICNSNNTRNIIAEMGINEAKISIVAPGVDMNEEKKEDERIAKLKEKYALGDKKIIFSVSRLVARKGQDKVIEALEHSVKKFPELRFVIAGEGPDKSRLEALAKQKKMGEYVIFTNKLSNGDLQAMYQIADLFIMPSREIKETGDIEGFGIVFLEANLHRLPVIAGKSGGIPDAVIDGKTGFLVDPLDVKGISEKINTLLEDRSLAKTMGDTGYDWVVQNCLWKHRVEVLEGIEV